MENKEISCAFIGDKPEHIFIDEGSLRYAMLRNRMDDMVDAMFNSGYRIFITNCNLGVDIWFAERIIDLKAMKKYSSLELIAIAADKQACKWSIPWKLRHQRILDIANKSYICCEKQQNYILLDMSSALIAVYEKINNGTGSIVQQARELGHTISIIDTDSF